MVMAEFLPLLLALILSRICLPEPQPYDTMTSSVRHWGQWGSENYCGHGSVMSGARARTKPRQHFKDDTGGG